MADDPHEIKTYGADPQRTDTKTAVMGRTSSYSDEIANEIFLRISEGESLRQICKDPHLPHRNTVLRWADSMPSFAAGYARARDAYGDWTVDDMASIEAGVLAGKIKPKEARVVLWSKQWRAERLAPKRYGSRVVQQHVGPGDGPVLTETKVSMTEDQFADVAKSVLGKI